MERLTKRTSVGAANLDYPEKCYCTDRVKGLIAMSAYRQKAFDRLAAYEDTGLEPEEVTAIKHALMGREIAKITEFEGIPIQRLQELAQAEKDGRLTVMPSNDPLTLEELREMDFGEWIWVQNLHTERPDILSGYYRKMDGYRPEDAFYFGYPEYEKVGHTAWGRYADYGTGWLAYRRKPEEALTSE